MATLNLSLLLILACSPDGSNAGVDATPGTTARAKAAASLADLGPGDLLITEIMQNPAAVSDTAGEWFEVLNNTASTVDLDGLEVSDTRGTGFTVSGSLELAAGARAVFGRRTDRLTNGGVTVDYAFGSAMSLANGADDLTLSYGGTTLDAVAWDGGATFPDPTGSAMSLDPDTGDATTNDDGGSWCESTSPYGAGDLGTPGAVNDSCGGGDSGTDESPLAALGDGDLIITEILHDPSVVSDTRGEWFEVFNDAGSSLELEGLEVWDSAGQGFTVGTSLVVADGGRVVFGRSAVSGTNGGAAVDYAYGSSLTLGNGTDDLSVGYAGLAFDTVTWDNGATMPDPSGASINLAPGHRDALENDDPNAWCVSTSVFGAGDLGTPGSVNDGCASDADTTLADLSAGDLVITEIMQNPSHVSDALGEWFEVRNTTGASVDLQGLFVYDTGWDMFMVTNALVVDAGDAVVFGRNSTTSVNGGVDVDYAYGSAMSLGNSRDSLVLAWGTTLFDAVSWDDGASFPDPRGASMGLDGSVVDATDNDDGGNWCASTATYGSGDLGTPGDENGSCPGVSTGGNSAPVVSAVTLLPASVGTDDTLTASVTATDADGDAISLAYGWAVNGTTVAETGASLDGALWFDRDDTVVVVVTPSDATATGTAKTSSAVTIANGAPTAPVAAVSPVNPAEGDDLVCGLATPSTDVDGDSLSYSVSWTVDGSPTSGTGTAALTGDTVASTATAAGQSWACTLNVTDGTDSAVSAVSTVSVTTEICPVYADPSVTPGGNGSSADPYPSIAYAIAYRGTCDEIVLEPGTYDERVDYGGEDLYIRSSGGAEVTIIEPSIGGTGVSFVDGETEVATLEGVTVRGGDNSGIRIDSADPTIMDCIIEDNTATNGAGVYASGYGGAFTNNLVRDNTGTTYAGGLYLYNSTAEVVGNTFQDNDSGSADGVYITLGSPTFEANVVYSNEGENLRVYNASALIANNVFSQATSTNVHLYHSDASLFVNNTLYGAGSYNLRTYNAPATTVVNNIIASSGSIEVYASTSSWGSMSFRNNNVYGTGTEYYNVSEQTGNNGNISQHPAFTDAANQDFSLGWGSPAIDRGADPSGYGVTSDHDGAQREQGPATDMGAFEFEGPTDDCDGTDDGDHCATACPVYVDGTATPGGNGAEADPYASISYALAYRGSCTEVLLEPGTYDENIDFGGEDLLLSSTSGAASTIIEPLVGGKVIAFENGETQDAILSDLTISGGSVAGIYISAASPTITDCIIEHNDGSTAGGVYASQYGGEFTGNTVRDNTAASNAGGLYLYNSTASVLSNTFEANTGSYAGAIYIYRGSPVVEANWIEGNGTGSQAGGIRIYDATALVANNVLVDNLGAGLYVYYQDGSSILNNTIVGSSSYGAYIYNAPKSTMMNNIISDSGSYDVYASHSNTWTNMRFTNNNVYGGSGYYGATDQTGTNDNISQDPEFVDPGNGDFSMVWGSNSIDHGVDVSSYGVTSDYDGASRSQGLGTDLGAVESY